MGQKGEKLIYTSLNYLIFFLELKNQISYASPPKKTLKAIQINYLPAVWSAFEKDSVLFS
jgi:hypothetical protein